MEIAEKIKELRKENNQTQEGLSKDLNLPRYLISNWEQGRSLPAHEDLIKLADYFNCSIDYLFGREEDTFQSIEITNENIIPMENIGKNLKYNRENAKKSVYDIETDLGISHQNQYNWEKGTREPSIVHCVKLADYFGISIDELIGRDFSGTVSTAPIHATLPEDERELLSLFSVLSQEDKRGVLRIARSLAGDVKSATVPKAN